MSTVETAIPALLRGLVDDAALFPPGNAPMDMALAEHRHHRAAPYAEFVGPFLAPASRWDELVGSLGDGPPLDLGLIGPTEALLETIDKAYAEPRVRLVQVECTQPPGEDLPARARASGLLLDAALDDSNLFVELPRGTGWLDAIAALDGADTRHFLGAKLRTGGLTADAFPTDGELAEFVRRCMAADHPFKLTAGLHRAVRHTDPATGFEHHGYLNVLAATCLGWLDRPPLADVAEAIGTRSSAPLLDIARAMLERPGEATESRTWFFSYGSCSVAEPLTDLADLGLLDPELLRHLPPARKEHA